MELLLTTAILILLIVSVGILLIANGTIEVGAKVKHKPIEYLLSSVRVAIEHNTDPIVRVRGSP
jgi:hypothetical protein